MTVFPLRDGIERKFCFEQGDIAPILKEGLRGDAKLLRGLRYGARFCVVLRYFCKLLILLSF